MLIDVNIWVVLAAALSNVIIGFLWYHPKAFGTIWMRVTGVSPEEAESGAKKMPIMALVAFVASFVMAWVLAHFAFVWGALTVGSALELGFWVWLGFMVPILLSPILWEGKHTKYLAINAGYWLVAVLVASVIITLWI